MPASSVLHIAIAWKCPARHEVAACRSVTFADCQPSGSFLFCSCSPHTWRHDGKCYTRHALRQEDGSIPRSASQQCLQPTAAMPTPPSTMMPLIGCLWAHVESSVSMALASQSASAGTALHVHCW